MEDRSYTLTWRILGTEKTKTFETLDDLYRFVYKHIEEDLSHLKKIDDYEYRLEANI